MGAEGKPSLERRGEAEPLFSLSGKNNRKLKQLLHSMVPPILRMDASSTITRISDAPKFGTKNISALPATRTVFYKDFRPAIKKLSMSTPLSIPYHKFNT